LSERIKLSLLHDCTGFVHDVVHRLRVEHLSLCNVTMELKLHRVAKVVFHDIYTQRPKTGALRLQIHRQILL
jgi:hypothetical protein